MTAEEAILRIEEHKEIHFKEEYPRAIKITEAFDVAIEALETISELEKRGITVDVINEYKTFEDECVSKGFSFKSLLEAREKQIPKKPIIEPWSPALCPCCGTELSEDMGDGYYKHQTCLERCPNAECGQRLKWSE